MSKDEKRPLDLEHKEFLMIGTAFKDDRGWHYQELKLDANNCIELFIDGKSVQVDLRTCYIARGKS